MRKVSRGDLGRGTRRNAIQTKSQGKKTCQVKKIEPESKAMDAFQNMWGTLAAATPSHNQIGVPDGLRLRCSIMTSPMATQPE